MAHSKIENRQINMFQSTEYYRIKKPIRLIELFAGYGSQALALKYLGVPFEHWCISEWAIKSIKAYKNLHFTDEQTNYAADLSDDEILDYLDGRISSDYCTPLTRAQIAKKPFHEIYNEMKQTHNCGSITKMTVDDLNIVDTDKYCYILTYSFPCQDLSLSGKTAGMKKGDNTRSGLLWEVERLLKECKAKGELPQVLLLENVPEVIGAKNVDDFNEWLSFLTSIGYSSKYQIYNTTEFKIPQNRERFFMVSVCGDYDIPMPTGRPLKLKLKDILETKVSEKYFLRDKTIEMFMDMDDKNKQKNNGFAFKPTAGGGIQQQ